MIPDPFRNNIIRPGIKPEDLTNELVAEAADYAKMIHKPQVRKYTGEPYFVHLVEVGMTLEWAGCDPEVVAAGFLHDSIEDQGQTVVGSISVARLGHVRDFIH